MANVLVLGAGMMGRTIAYDLSKDFYVTVVDKYAQPLSTLREFVRPDENRNTIDTFEYDMFADKSPEALLTRYDIIVGALPGDFGYRAAEIVLGAGCDYVDISFAPEDLRKLNYTAVKSGARCIIDFGVAPGLSHLLFGYFNSFLKKINKYHIFVGGLVDSAPGPWHYRAPFSPTDVIEEYTRPARFIEGGKVKTLPALSSIEEIGFKYHGWYEAFLTDGVRTLLDHTQVDSIVEKTIRPIGYCEKIKLLIDTGFFNNHDCEACEVTKKLLIDAWKMQDADEDKTLMRIDVEGEDRVGLPFKRSYHMCDLHDGTNTSMARTTGFMCTAGVRLMLSDLWPHKGVFAPELIGSDKKCFEFILDELKKRNISFRDL